MCESRDTSTLTDTCRYVRELPLVLGRPSSMRHTSRPIKSPKEFLRKSIVYQLCCCSELSGQWQGIGWRSGACRGT
ncbi:hypothetical protein DPMN_000447 [Dreissena polymorpha]|uniref:Uncharacterized protein n=1 Tax=Dreissena polymorpha TaxID=45954 RepID=A0A9D4RS15_DREPO|nr:hypothetical protein DPMN_000447 [Dreissena polymorpha]